MALRSSPWWSTLRRREQEALVYNLVHKPLPGKASHLAAIDISQRVDRCPRGYDGTLPTLVPRSDIWLVGSSLDQGFGNRLMLGAEAMSAQGFPINLVLSSGCSNAQLKNIAGNAFSATVYGAIMIAVFAFSPKPVTGKHHDLDGLMRLQDMMQM